MIFAIFIVFPFYFCVLEHLAEMVGVEPTISFRKPGSKPGDFANLSTFQLNVLMVPVREFESLAYSLQANCSTN